MLIVDAANVIGSRPTGLVGGGIGWERHVVDTWRVSGPVWARVRDGRLESPVVVVLEGQARQGADEGDVDGVEVIHAPGEGDETIVSSAAAHRGAVVVTADRVLAERVERSKPTFADLARCSRVDPRHPCSPARLTWSDSKCRSSAVDTSRTPSRRVSR